MREEELRKACKALSKLGPPEVVLVQATRSVRFGAPAWKGQLARFCLMLEDIFQSAMPGVVVVTDEPHAAYRLKDELWERNHKRDLHHRWRMRHEFRISGIPSTRAMKGYLRQELARLLIRLLANSMYTSWMPTRPRWRTD